MNKSVKFFDKKKIAISSLTLLIISFLFGYYICSNKSEDKISKLNNEVLELQSKLKESEELQTGYKQILEKERVASQEKFKSIIDDLNKFETRVNESLIWFKKNSILPEKDPNRNFEYLKKDLSYCGTRIIDLTCIAYANSEEGLAYQEDIETSPKGREEFLQSLNRFMGNKGGDCEDFALFFTAEFNYLKQIGKVLPIEIETCVPYEGYEHSISGSYSYQSYYALPDCKTETFQKEYMYPVCGGYVNDKYGHCLVILSNIKVEESSDINKVLEEGILIEPMDGTIVVNDFEASMFITPDDLKIIWEESLEWEGYLDYLARIKKMEEEISQ